VNGDADRRARVNVLGLGIDPLTMPLAVATIGRWIASRERRYICVAAVHSVMACRHDPSLRGVFKRSGLTTPDGMPLVWLCRLAGHRAERVYGPDLVLAVCAASVARGWRHYFFGGGPGVAQVLAERMQDRFAGLQVAGTFTPPFGDSSIEVDEANVRRVNETLPDIVWVGLGTGRQEHWMADHRDRLEAPLLIGVGAAFDFLSGRKPQAPRWLQRSGLEWLFRLASEPGRLWPRYREYPLFLILLAAQRAGLREFRVDEA
jgi:N-acetylglucosaminyldiphosphoundecaprenol N-acetyl-beta-D-mannosaminyltransferase